MSPYNSELFSVVCVVLLHGYHVVMLSKGCEIVIEILNSREAFAVVDGFEWEAFCKAVNIVNFTVVD